MSAQALQRSGRSRAHGRNAPRSTPRQRNGLVSPGRHLRDGRNSSTAPRNNSRRLWRSTPRMPSVLNYYGYMLGDLGQRLDEAESLVQRALKEEPFNGAYLDSLGWIYYKQNKLTDAEATLRKAVERDSHDPTIHSHLGDVYAKLGPHGAGRRGMGEIAVRMAPLAARGHRERQDRRDREKTRPDQTSRGAEVRSARRQAMRRLNRPHARNPHPSVRENQSAAGHSRQALRRLSRAPHHFSDHLPA